MIGNLTYSIISRSRPTWCKVGTWDHNITFPFKTNLVLKVVKLLEGSPIVPGCICWWQTSPLYKHLVLELSINRDVHGINDGQWRSYMMIINRIWWNRVHLERRVTKIWFEKGTMKRVMVFGN